MSLIRISFAFSLMFSLLACGGNTFGFSRTYEPNDQEESFGQVGDVGYQEVARSPDDFHGVRVAWFGTIIGQGADGRSLKLAYRRLQPRNYCSGREESSCRVTVSERSLGEFWVRTKTEAPGGNGALIRVLGSFGQAEDKLPTIDAKVLRYWPTDVFVTTAMRSRLRR